MNSIKKAGLLSCILFLACIDIYVQANESKSKSTAMQQILIDKFIVPAEAKEEFLNRLKISMELLGTIPGLVETTAYEQIGSEGKINYVTTAVWESAEALEHAKETVKAAYQKEEFNPQEMFERLNISMDRAVYKQRQAVPNVQEQNKEMVRRLYEDCLNKRNFELLDEFIAEDYEGIQGETGPTGFAKTVQSVIHAFPDIQWTIEDLISEGNKVVVRWSWRGTHTGTFREFIRPTQNTVTHDAINIYEFRGSKITKAWMQSDRLGFFQQVGMIPEDLTVLSQSNKQ